MYVKNVAPSRVKWSLGSSASKVIPVKPLQPSNAFAPRLVTLAGMVKLPVKPAQP